MWGRLANKALRKFGLKLERVSNHHRGHHWYVGDVANRVSTLIDVGVAHGTPNFYELNPKAELFLIDPLEEYEGAIREILERRRGRYKITALGDETGSAVINVQLDHLTKSSLLDQKDLSRVSGRVARRTIPVTTLDNVVREHDLRAPFGIKIDTEGFELSVICGAEETLVSSAFVIAETSVQKRFEGSYEFVDFINEMHRRGFRVANILSATPDHTGEVRFMDILYVRENQSS